jgi:hypothetical protein
LNRLNTVNASAKRPFDRSWVPSSIGSADDKGLVCAVPGDAHPTQIPNTRTVVKERGFIAFELRNGLRPADLQKVTPPAAGLAGGVGSRHDFATSLPGARIE